MTSLPPAFDPRQAPVWQSATAALHTQPAPPAQTLTVAGMQARFANAHSACTNSPPAAPHLETGASLQRQTPAAVLIGLQATAPQQGANSALHILLTQRTAHLHAHAGQIAFPGGKIDAQDSSAIAAALRESHEEIGLHPACVQPLGCLPRFITTSGYGIVPVVALVQTHATLTANPHEVDDIFTVPLDFVMTPRNHRRHRLQDNLGRWRDWYAMPWQDPISGTQRYIWGVTAAILRSLYTFLLTPPPTKEHPHGLVRTPLRPAD